MPVGEDRVLEGLSSEEAARLLAEHGHNELPSTKRHGPFAVLGSLLKEPMLALLVVGGLLYLLIGDVQEALILLLFVIVVIGITTYQQNKTERALEALRDLSSPRALVIRDGRKVRVPGRDVVPGDLVLLAEGDRVPADALLDQATNLEVDESLLTGESVPVRKRAGPNEAPSRPGGDDLPNVFSGTLVVRGQGIGKVVATGAQTEIGRIGRALQVLRPERTRLQSEVDRLVKDIAAIAVALSAVIAVVYGLRLGDWLSGALAGIALAMALLPEEFPVVLTVFLALGAWRISRQHVLTRRMPVVETLGAATVLCVDKTGTLTENRMTVREIAVADGMVRLDGQPQLPESFHRAVEYAVLASPVDPFDPMDIAFKGLAAHYLGGTEHVHADWRLVREYPLTGDLLALSHVWRSPEGGQLVVAAKGAPEAIFELCHLPQEERATWDQRFADMADRGMRVLGVAAADCLDVEHTPPSQHDFDFRFIGLLGLEDPVRPEVEHAIAESASAGIRVIIVTGDYPGTAAAVARRVGLPDPSNIVTGADVERMTDPELASRISSASVFARVVPEQKLRLVQSLRSQGEVVAMTGDGVNDSPALKAADIGIAMGERGADVAREAADLVLTKDDFESIVGAIAQGRRVFDNLKKAMTYILAVHVPIAGMSLLPVVFGWPIVLGPVHIAFLELIIDPASSIVFEAQPPEADVMDRPPRPLGQRLLSGRMLGLGLTQGAVALTVVLAVFLIGLLPASPDVAHVRALTFTTLVVANLGLILANLSWTRPIVVMMGKRNIALRWVLGGTAVFLSVVLFTPVREVFRFSVLGLDDIALAVVAGGSSVLWFELLKQFDARRHRPVA